MEQASLIIGDGNWAVKSGSLLGYTMFNEQFYPQDITASRATTATRVDENGLIVTSSVDIARIDYSTGEAALLVEPLRTNLLRFSEQFDNAAWTKSNATITANSNTSPSGVVNADTLVANVGTATTYFLDFTTLTGTGIFTASVFAKKGNSNWLYIRQGNSGGGTTLARAWFDLNNGTIGTTSPAPISHKIEDYGNGWYRCSMTFEVLSGGIPRPQFYISNGDGVISFDSDGTQSINLWGAQLEAGAYATSYIPTVASTVTRNADVISKTGISDLIGQSEGTVFLNTKYSASNSTSSRWFNLLGVDSVIGLALNSLNFVRTIINGASDTITTSPKTDLGVKLAFAYNSLGVVLFINGVQYALPNGGSQIITSLNSIVFFNPIVNTQLQQANINSFMTFPTRLSNETLTQLTTP